MYICLFSLLTAKFAIDHQSIFLMREVSSGESSFKKHFVCNQVQGMKSSVNIIAKFICTDCKIQMCIFS